MNGFDYRLLLALNQFADGHPLLSKLVASIYADPFKSVFISALLWWAWFDDRQGPARQQAARERVAASLAGCVATIAGVRLLAEVLPFRIRPLLNQAVALHFPLTQAEGWGHWSAFPSDNAVMFSMLATCLFTISRTLGALAFLDTILLVLFPRVFLGIHHPTDVLAGVLIGVAIGWAISWERVCRPLSRPAFALLRGRPAAFYAGAFVFTFLIGEVFWPLTRIAVQAAHLARTQVSLPHVHVGRLVALGGPALVGLALLGALLLRAGRARPPAPPAPPRAEPPVLGRIRPISLHTHASSPGVR